MSQFLSPSNTSVHRYFFAANLLTSPQQVKALYLAQCSFQSQLQHVSCRKVKSVNQDFMIISILMKSIHSFFAMIYIDLQISFQEMWKSN
jgi:hypothetical protein